MPPKSRAFKELMALVAQYALEPYVQSTRSLVALLDAGATPVSWNPSFESLKQTLPDALALREFVLSDKRSEYDNLLREAQAHHSLSHAQLDLGVEHQRGRYDCQMVPLPDGRYLFMAEPVFTTFDLPEKYQRLLEQFEQVNTELQETKRIVEKKEVEREAVLAQVEELRDTDPLTYLINHRAILGDLQHAVTYSERYDSPLTISMLDLDHFKNINETFGHSTGDDVLKTVAMLLHDHIRLPDIIGRYGGEEFLVLLPNSTIKAAGEQAARLCQLVRVSPIISGKHAINMTISIGIAQYRVHEEDWQKLLNRADQALYQAKMNGRDQWVAIEA